MKIKVDDIEPMISWKLYILDLKQQIRKNSFNPFFETLHTEGESKYNFRGINALPLNLLSAIFYLNLMDTVVFKFMFLDQIVQQNSVKLKVCLPLPPDTGCSLCTAGSPVHELYSASGQSSRTHGHVSSQTGVQILQRCLKKIIINSMFKGKRVIEFSGYYFKC